MAKRTYVPKLIGLLRVLCLYIVRWRNALVGALTDLGVSNPSTKLDAIIAACEAVTSEVDLPVNP